MMVRDKNVVFLEFEQLLNLFFRTEDQSGASRWKRDPFLRALQSFCLDACQLASREELREFVLKDWMLRKQDGLNQDTRNSIHELLNTHLPLRN